MTQLVATHQHKAYKEADKLTYFIDRHLFMYTLKCLKISNSRELKEHKLQRRKTSKEGSNGPCYKSLSNPIAKYTSTQSLSFQMQYCYYSPQVNLEAKNKS